MDRKCTYCIFSKNAFFAVCFESIFHQKKDELLWFSVSQHSSGMKNWITSEVARVWKVSRIALQSFKLILAWFSIYLDLQLKVRQIRNDFFKPTFLPKKPLNKFTLLLVNLFLFVIWKKVKTPKRHFEINWPLIDLGNCGLLWVYQFCS